MLMPTAVPISRIIIFGHRGFIGSQLATRFREFFPRIEIVGISSTECDLADWQSVEALAPLMDKSAAVIACSGVKKQWGDTLENFSKNINMATNLCRLLHMRPVKRLVYFSSAEVYGEELDNQRITEDTPVCLTSYYGLAKYTSEQLLIKTADASDISLLLVRPPLVYGAGDFSRGYGPSGFIWSALNREDITLWGDGTETRSLLYIEDLVDIIGKLALSEHKGIVNVANGRSVSFLNLVEILTSLVPGGVSCKTRPRTKGKVDNVYCVDRLAAMIPNLAFTPIEAGMKLTLEAARLMKKEL